MRRIDQDNFVVLVDVILVDPVRVENTEIAASATDTLFGRGFERPLVLELVHTLVRRLSVHDT